MKRLLAEVALIVGLFSGLIVLAQDEGETIAVSGQEVQVMPRCFE